MRKNISNYFYKPIYIPPELRNIILNYLQQLFDHDIYETYYCIYKELFDKIIDLKKSYIIKNMKSLYKIGRYTIEFDSLKYTCLCGSRILCKSKRKHNKTNKHLNYLKNNNLLLKEKCLKITKDTQIISLNGI